MAEALTQKDIKQALQGQWIIKGKASVFSGVGTDTRQSLTGKVFFALKGPRFDGHDFLPEAQAKGAALLIASHQGKIQAFIEKGHNSVGLLQVGRYFKSFTGSLCFLEKKAKLKSHLLYRKQWKNHHKKVYGNIAFFSRSIFKP